MPHRAHVDRTGNAAARCDAAQLKACMRDESSAPLATMIRWAHEFGLHHVASRFPGNTSGPCPNRLREPLADPPWRIQAREVDGNFRSPTLRLAHAVAGKEKPLAEASAGFMELSLLLVRGVVPQPVPGLPNPQFPLEDA